MDIWQHIIHPRDVWGHLSRYLKQGGHAAVQREVVRSLRLRARDVVLDLGGGGHALAQLALYSGTVYGVAASTAAVSAATVRNRHDVARGRIQICRGAFPALPFPAAMFHVITAFEPAFWAGDLSACLREIRRLLRPGGQCVLVCADERQSGGHVPAGQGPDELNALADRKNNSCRFQMLFKISPRNFLHCFTSRPGPSPPGTRPAAWGGTDRRRAATSAGPHGPCPANAGAAGTAARPCPPGR